MRGAGLASGFCRSLSSPGHCHPWAASSPSGLPRYSWSMLGSFRVRLPLSACSSPCCSLPRPKASLLPRQTPALFPTGTSSGLPSPGTRTVLETYYQIVALVLGLFPERSSLPTSSPGFSNSRVSLARPSPLPGCCLVLVASPKAAAPFLNGYSGATWSI